MSKHGQSWWGWVLGDRGGGVVSVGPGTASHVRVREDASDVIKLGPSYAAGMSRRSLDGGESSSMRSPRAPKADFKEGARSNIQKLSEKQRDLLVQRVEKTILDALKAEARKVTGAKPVADEFCAALQEHVGCKCLAPLFAPLRPTRDAPVAPRTDPVPRPLPTPYSCHCRCRRAVPVPSRVRRRQGRRAGAYRQDQDCTRRRLAENVREPEGGDKLGAFCVDDERELSENGRQQRRGRVEHIVD